MFVALIAISGFARTRAVSRGTPADAFVWLQQRATAIENIVPLFGDAKILALADATHGTHEFFDVKRQLLPQLAARGFNVLVFEGPYAEFDALRHGADAAAVIQSPDYFFWDTDEVLDTIDWARSHGVDVVGIDCAHPQAAAEMVITYLQQVDVAAAKQASTRYGCLSRNYANLPSSLQRGCRADIAEVRPWIESQRAGYVAKTSTDEYEHVLHAARVVEQGELSLTTLPQERDACMAENIDWLLAMNPDAKILLWGHNEHFGKTAYTLLDRTTKSTGTYLSERHGDAYRSIGSIALQGSFWALDPQYVITQQVMTPVSDDDYARFFATAGRDAMFVSFTGALPLWLRDAHRIRIGASTPGTHELIENLPQRFDGMIYFETSTPSRMRHF